MSQKELEDDYEKVIEYTKANQEGICIISNDDLKSLMVSFEAYQLFVDKKLTVLMGT